ncbi:MAG: RNA polymerase sigma factor [Planctomycetota bacterium]
MTAPAPAPDPADKLAITNALADSARRGNVADLERLFERLKTTVFAWICMRTGNARRGATDPNDLLQEVWLRTLRAFPTFDPARGSFRSWVFGIAAHVLLEEYRRTSRVVALDAPADSSSAGVTCEPPSPSMTSVGARLARAEAVDRFLAYADSLSPEDRKLLLYHGLEEMTLADVAERLQITVAAAEKRWQRLKSKLQASGVARDLDLGDCSRSSS